MTDTDDALERSALSKASWRLLPIILIAYGAAYMDRVNIGFAAATMNRDLHFSATAYGLGGGLFFLSYALLEVPSNLMLVRFGPRRWMARIMITWGLLASGMMFVKTPMEFYVMRFLLGAAEAGFFPGVIYYLTLFFPASQRGKAITRFYIAAPLSTVFMGAVAGGLLGLNGKLGLAGWQWLFLVEGLPAIVMSAVFLFCMPDSPARAVWLTEPEKSWLVRRLAADAAALGPQDHSARRALASPLVLTFGALNFIMLGTWYAFTLSAPQLLGAATHLDATGVGYLTSLGGLLGAASMLFNGWNSDRTGERHLHLTALIVLTAAGFAAVAFIGTPPAVVLGYLVGVTAYFGVIGTIWLIPGERMHPASAAVSIAAINGIGQFGSFLAPFAWGVAKDRTGSYQLGLTALVVLVGIAALIVLGLRARDRAASA